MEASKERIIAQLELETQEYSVFITDEKRTSSGKLAMDMYAGPV